MIPAKIARSKVDVGRIFFLDSHFFSASFPSQGEKTLTTFFFFYFVFLYQVRAYGTRLCIKTLALSLFLVIFFPLDAGIHDSVLVRRVISAWATSGHQFESNTRGNECSTPSEDDQSLNRIFSSNIDISWHGPCQRVNKKLLAKIIKNVTRREERYRKMNFTWIWLFGRPRSWDESREAFSCLLLAVCNVVWRCLVCTPSSAPKRSINHCKQRPYCRRLYTRSYVHTRVRGRVCWWTKGKTTKSVSLVQATRMKSPWIRSTENPFLRLSPSRRALLFLFPSLSRTLSFRLIRATPRGRCAYFAVTYFCRRLSSSRVL